MNIEIICVGKLKEAFWRDAVNEYAKRLGRFCTFSVNERKEARLPANPSPADELAVKETFVLPPAVAITGAAFVPEERVTLSCFGFSGMGLSGSLLLHPANSAITRNRENKRLIIRIFRFSQSYIKRMRFTIRSHL